MGGIQHQSGHSDLSTSNVGLVISSENPWLAASPDDRVHDPQASLPHGLSEYKDHSAAKDMTTDEACEKIKRVCIKNNMNTKHKPLTLTTTTTIKFNASCTATRNSGVTLW